jgi:kinesin family protein 15
MRMKNPLPPRPPPSNPLKRKLSAETATESGFSDSGVKVIVRMKPLNKGEEGDMIVEKMSKDSLTVSGQTFTFDSIANPESTQARYLFA